MTDFVRYKVQLPRWAAQELGPGWTELLVRANSTDEDVIQEVWIEDTYQVGQLRNYDWGNCRTVLDIGACTGLFSALICQLFPKAHVVAVEPGRENFDLLFLNTQAWRSRVETIRSAVGFGDGEAVLLGEEGDGHTVPPELVEVDRYDVVSQVSLDTLVTTAVTTSHIALLKVDVEGAEYDIISGASSELLDRVDYIAMEWHGPSECPWVDNVDARYGQLLAKLAYTHSVSAIGVPSAGGMLFAHHKDL